MRKHLATLTLFFTLITCALATGSPSDPLSFIVSQSLFVNLVKIALAAAVFQAAYHLERGSIVTKSLLGMGAVSLVIFGTLTLSITPMLGELYDYIRILDIMIIMQLGVLLGLTALEIKREPSLVLEQFKTFRASYYQRPKRIYQLYDFLHTGVSDRNIVNKLEEGL